MTAVIVVTQDGPDRWSASRGGRPAGRLHVLLRPDHRTCLYPRDVIDDAYPALLDAVLGRYPDELYVEVDDAAVQVRNLLAERGFAVRRHEHHYRVPTRATGAALPPGFTCVSAAESDVDRLRELDDALRQDVPGASGWRNDPAGFRTRTFGDPEFDPATYLVAVHEHGTYAGLVRVWARPEVSRLGLIGVLPGYRRRGLASALLARAFGVVAARGQPEVVCEVDDTNVASNTLMAGLGARRIGGAVEMARPATR